MDHSPFFLLSTFAEMTVVRLFCFILILLTGPALAATAELRHSRCLHELLPDVSSEQDVLLNVTVPADVPKIKTILEIPGVAKTFGEMSDEEFAKRGGLMSTRSEYTISRHGQVVGVLQTVAYSNKNRTFSFLGKDETWVAIGYAVDPYFWGQGIATEAVRQALWFMDETSQPQTYIVSVSAANPASAAVLEKNGFKVLMSHPDGSVDYVRSRSLISPKLKKAWAELLSRMKKSPVFRQGPIMEFN